MIEFADMIDKEFEQLPDSIYIRSVHFAPINKDGRAVSCFTPFHIGYPDRSVQDGNHLETLCWYAESYAVSKLYRKNARNLQAIGDCKACKFCLKNASGYYLALSVDAPNMDNKQISDKLQKTLLSINKKLNKPLSMILVGNHETGESWEINLSEVN